MSRCSLLVFKALWEVLYRRYSAFIAMQLLATHIYSYFQLNEDHQQCGLTPDSVCKALRVGSEDLAAKGISKAALHAGTNTCQWMQADNESTETLLISV